MLQSLGPASATAISLAYYCQLSHDSTFSRQERIRHERRTDANFAAWRLAHFVNAFGDFTFKILSLFPILPAGFFFTGSKRPPGYLLPG